jgi:large subunit ribosomal protein L35
MKTKSGAKKRFRFTASGLVKFGPARKRHGMTKRSKRMIRGSRRMSVMAPGDARHVYSYMPYGGGL